MYSLDIIKKEIVIEINKALGSKIIKVSDLIYPPNQKMGELSLPCFLLSKEFKKNPAEIARDVIKKININKNFKFNLIINSIVATGPYVNFILNKVSLTEKVLTEITDQVENYGKNKNKNSRKIIVEYSNVNTHKEYHVGHLRNICYGDAVNNILNINGNKSIPISYVNDFGIHVAKTIWAYLEFYKNEKLPENKGEFLGKVYACASKKSKDNKIAKQMIEVIMKKIESRAGDEYKLWQKTRKWSIEQFDKIYKELNIKFNTKMYESEFIDDGIKIIPDLIKKGILEKSQGAVIANLEKYNLGVLVVLRSDGTATYPVADIPLALEKIKKFKPDESIFVVDIRQKLYFKQLFKIIELMGHKQKMTHLGYEFVKLPDGMMSSRSGNTITYAELKNKIINKVKEETKKRHSDWSDEKIKKTADIITVSIMKFEMIKIKAEQEIIFDINKALSLNGFTATYLQYACARINSVLKKAKINKQKLDYYKNLTEEKEHKLIIKMAKYPEIIKRAGEKYDPSEIAKYLFELAKNFNDYYHSVQILKANEKEKKSKLTLIYSIRQILKNGLNILGIKAINEM